MTKTLPTIPAVVSAVRGDLARYDHEQSALATTCGRAALKMAGASVPCRVSVDPTRQTASFFWVQNGALVCSIPGGTVDQVTPKVIADAVLGVGQKAVPLSPDVTRAASSG